MPLKPRGLLLDFGNVLGLFDHPKACRRLSSRTKGRLSPVEIRSMIFGGPDAPAKKHEDGSLNRREFYMEVMGLLKLNISSPEFSDIWSDIFSPNEGVEKVIGKVHSEVRLAVCSNTDPIHWGRIEYLPVMMKYFRDEKKLARSYDPDIKTRKPGEKIFKKALERLGGLEFPEVVYVDDIPEYVEAFQKLGGNAFLYNARETPLSVLEDSLRQYNVLV